MGPAVTTLRMGKMTTSFVVVALFAMLALFSIPYSEAASVSDIMPEEDFSSQTALVASETPSSSKLWRSFSKALKDTKKKRGKKAKRSKNVFSVAKEKTSKAKAMKEKYHKTIASAQAAKEKVEKSKAREFSRKQERKAKAKAEKKRKEKAKKAAAKREKGEKNSKVRAKEKKLKAHIQEKMRKAELVSKADNMKEKNAKACQGNDPKKREGWE